MAEQIELIIDIEVELHRILIAKTKTIFHKTDLEIIVRMTITLLFHKILAHDMVTKKHNADYLDLPINPLINHPTDVTLVMDTDLVHFLQTTLFQNKPFRLPSRPGYSRFSRSRTRLKTQNYYHSNTNIK